MATITKQNGSPRKTPRRDRSRLRPRLETLEGRTLLANLIINGDYESGNSGFTSSYAYSPGDLRRDTVYDILRNPSSAHSIGVSFGDHTTGSGLMMAVNGSVAGNVTVWSQTV